MLSKARLVKKQTRQRAMKLAQKPHTTTKKHEHVLLTQNIIQTTKDWLTNRHQQQTNARQTFAALFTKPDTHLNAV